MLITRSSVNTRHHIYLENFFLAVKTFKIHLFSNLQTCNIVLLTIITML